MLTLVLWAGMASLIVVGRASNRGMRELVETQANLSATAHEASAARVRAEAASMAKTRFLANMSHELRTPLNAVIGAAQLLRAERANPEQQAHLVDAIQRSGSNLLALIENILDLSRIEAGEMNLRSADFHLVECFDSALASAGLAAQAKGLRLACIFSPELAAWRHGDADRLRQVVINLLGNAVKFTVNGDVTVHVEQGHSPGSIRVRVTDTGVGIDAAALALIFEPFRQADEGADRRYGGSGLGLAIVRQLIEAMGGQIAVTSQPGVGSCFEFELPLPLARAASTELLPLAHQVVFHEPHEPSANALEAHLLRLGCRVHRCDTASEAVQALVRMTGDEKPWLLLAVEAPEHDALLDAVEDLIAPERVIVMADRVTYAAGRVNETVRTLRQLARPLTCAALVSCMKEDCATEARALPVAHNLLTAPQRATQAHVLVVEDDELNRTIVCRMLKHAGYCVSATGDGQQALQMLAQPERVDLVIMDWQMPGIDGVEVTRRLRAGAAGDAGRTVPIVALTANAFAEDREACLAAGMSDFLTKPVQAASLMAAVAHWTTSAPIHAAASAPVAFTNTHTGVAVFEPSVLAALPMVADGSAPEYAQELLAMFLDSCEQAVSDIEQATAADDAPALLRLVHTLKSISASVGATEIAQLAGANEAQLRQGGLPQIDLSQQLHTALHRLRQATCAETRAAAQGI
jgi:two-component system sensor histidine kinase BarA